MAEVLPALISKIERSLVTSQAHVDIIMKGALAVNERDINMAVSMNWGALGLGSVVAFLIGWFLFGLLGAILLAVIVLILMGILVIK